MRVSPGLDGRVASASEQGARGGLLFLLFTLGGQRFALPARDIVEVLPQVALKPIPQAPGWVGGLFAYRGQIVPVIDLSHLALGRPATARTSTRLVLVHHTPGRCLGLVLEHASETLRCDPAQFIPIGLHTPRTPYLGPVREDEHGLLQWVTVGELLDERVIALLYGASTPTSLDGQGA